MPARRILISNYEYPPLGGGGSTASKWIGYELARRGHDVEVVTSGFRGYPADSPDGDIRVRRLPVLRRQAGQSNPIEMMSFVASAAPYLLFRGKRPDVVISFHSIPSGLAAFPMSRLRGVPHIVLFRGGDVPGWLPGELELYHRLTLWLNRWIVYSSARALANSDGLARLAQSSFPKKKVGVLYNGVDLKGFTPPMDGREQRDGDVRLLFVGRVTTQKGIDSILRALGGGDLQSRKWAFDVVGTGPQLEEYRQLARQLGIANRVLFHGWLERDNLIRLYHEADVLVFPSRYEGMPNVVLEAAACGLPLIGTRIAGTEQIVEDGVNGFLLDVDDIDALRQKIMQLIDSSELRQQLGQQARRFAEKKWSWPARARELEHIIEKVLQQKKKRKKP